MHQASPDRRSNRDVRMRGFQTRAEVAAVLDLLDKRLHPLGAEGVDLRKAAGRVLAGDVLAEHAVPGFDRAAMDGYAVRGHETFGAGTYNPLEFQIIGESFPARPFHGEVGANQAVRIMTGAPLPSGADAVVPAEVAEQTGEGIVRVQEAVPPGRHVGRYGEDIQGGDRILSAGRTLRPQDLGVLASVGISTVQVHRRPSAVILVTGDELLPAGSKPEGFRIVDSNSVMLDALLHRDGASGVRTELIPDRREIIRDALMQSKEDVILISGGSSVGAEDHAPRIVQELGELCVHGIALRPASPAGVGFLDKRVVFLLPGNPVSCLCAYDLFTGPAVRRLGGRPMELPYPTRTLPLAAKIASMIGRLDYVRVRIIDNKVHPLATSGASILSSTTRADGFVLVPAELEGYAEGESVRVYLYDGPHGPLPLTPSPSPPGGEGLG